VIKKTQIKIFNQKTDWLQPWFTDKVVKILSSYGLNKYGQKKIKSIIRSSKIKSFDDLELALTKLNNGIKTNVNPSFRKLRLQVNENKKAYKRSTVEEHRVKSWPNNQKLKIYNPKFYFDIYKDFPFCKAPRFITKTTPIGSAGSCFASRIAHQLQMWGYNYIIKEDDLPPGFPIERIHSTNFRTSPARCGILFNTPSMRQMVERAYGLWTPEPILIRKKNGFIDPFRALNPLYKDINGYISDFNNHNTALRSALDACDVFILTLGLTEAWKFSETGDYASTAPVFHVDPTLIQSVDLSVEDNLNELERLYAVYKKHRKGIKLIISVSPVPLNRTFSQDHHVITANYLSKATLRLAAEAFCKKHPDNVFYFPSFEMVTFCTKNPWESDMRHVSSEGVSRVMALFRKMFFEDQTSNFSYTSFEEPVMAYSLKDKIKGFLRSLRTKR
jgi:hypothetical protein